MTWPLFVLFALVAPAPVIAFESFVTGPVVFVLAQFLYMLVDARLGADIWHPHVIMFFAVHLVMYGLGYFIIAWCAARLLSLIRGDDARRAVAATLVAAVGALALLPVYGGGGIFGGAHGSLFAFFSVLEETHFGPDAALKVYGPALTVLGLLALPRIRAAGKRPKLRTGS